MRGGAVETRFGKIDSLVNGARTLGSRRLALGLGSYRGLPIEEHDGANFRYRTVILRFLEQYFTIA